MNRADDQSPHVRNGWAALDTARQAWEWHGVTCHVRTNEDDVVGIVGALDLPDHRHVEIFVSDPNEDVWSTVEKWAVAGEWVVRAVLPLSALGRAHEVLREQGCELQGYWVQDDGRVVFGSVEIA